MALHKIAISHDYFFQYGGAEKVVEVWLEMYPDSVLYTLCFVPEKFSSSISLTNAWNEGRIKTTWLQYVLTKPLGQKLFKYLVWLYPIVMSFVTIKHVETLLISSTYCGKHVNISQVKTIIHYCHSPTRYLHGLVRETDMTKQPRIYQLLELSVKWLLKILDKAAADNLTRNGAVWVANSTYIQQEIAHAYSVSSTLLYPPTEVDHFLTLKKVVPKDQFYYYFGRVSFHKKIDIIIHACARLQKRLLISGGAGLQSEFDSLNNLIMSYDKTYPGTSERITLLGRSTDEERDMLLSQCTAFLFAGKEDYGISPIEAMASGTPIIMYQAGGALDYLKPGVNGVFAKDQTPESFMDAMTYLESHPLKEKEIRHSTLHLTRQRFERGIRELVEG